MKKNKSLIFIAAAVVVIVVAALLFGRGGKEAAVEYETQIVARDGISMSITATGTVNPLNKVDVGTQVSGIISNIYVDFNSEVEQGQLIARLDPSTLLAEKAVAEESLRAAEIDHRLQKKNYERQKRLFDRELISESEYDDAENAYLKAESNLRQSKLTLQRAEINLGYTQIYSPISGVVLSRAVDEGQTVASGYSTPTLFTIAADLREMQLVANIDEADIGSVAEGQRVSFTVDAYIDTQFEGTVKQVRLQSSSTSNVVTYEVVIDAPNPELKLKPGMTASATIYTLEKADVFAVPARALRFVPADFDAKRREELPETHVFVRLADGTTEPREVTAGISNGVQTEITSGLSEGDEVVTGVAGANRSEQNMSVSISM